MKLGTKTKNKVMQLQRLKITYYIEINGAEEVLLVRTFFSRRNFLASEVTGECQRMFLL